MFAPKFFKSSIFTSILGWRDGGIDPPRPSPLAVGDSVQVEVTPENWVRSRNAEDEDRTYSLRNPGAVFEAQPDSGRKARGKMKTSELK